MYLSWVGQVGVNSYKLTGDAVKLDWFPNESTSATDSGVKKVISNLSTNKTKSK
jgi:hypothetical protein